MKLEMNELERESIHNIQRNQRILIPPKTYNIRLHRISVNHYEYRMLEENKIQGLLSMEILPYQDGEGLYYDITRKQSLTKFFSTRKIEQKDIKTLILELYKVISYLPEYLLDEDSLLMDMEDIYVDRDFSLHLCYVPGFTNNISLQISKILSKMLSHIDHNDHEAVVLGYSLYQESQRKDYVFKDLLQIISQHQPKQEYDIKVEKVLEEGEIKQNTQEIEQRLRREKNENDRVKETMFSMEEEKNKMPIENNSISKKSGLLSRFFAKKSEMASESEPQFIIRSYDNDSNSKDWEEFFENYEHKKEMEDKILSLVEEEIDSGISEKYILKSMNKDIKDIRLSYFPFIIGKQERVCDYILEDEKVSRLHLQFEKKENKIYVKDLNSLYGTKICGEVVTREREREILVGNEIEIGELHFILQEN